MEEAIMVRAARTAAATAALAILIHPIAAETQNTRTMTVSVVDPANHPVRDALVCVGTEADRNAYGAARTDAEGKARVPIADAGPEGARTGIGALPAMAATVTANVGTRGGTVRGAISTGATVRLQASGGPACPADTAPTHVAGTMAIDPNAVLAGLARLPDRPIGERLGPLNRPEYCFGAAGQQCVDRVGRIGTCVLGSCLINAGSWLHDECCWRDRNGYLCSGQFEHVLTPPPGGGNPGINCQVEFYTAFTRLDSIFSWRRNVDFAVANSTGRVDHGAYCAPAGAYMIAGEEAMCCSRRVRQPNAVEGAAIVSARAINPLLPATPARICAA
jgi:hypothetical protein